ncbi:hypothetical protein FRC08_004517 [Ceratobasidium sp. 394]|nr:hypothetical protein FRC08_004517 [Ceratobasidium sp. 394]KAG9090620.1 hypothetical protein FS749_000411 [Ceratobasidium sp. UAMH 11750]
MPTSTTPAAVFAMANCAEFVMRLMASIMLPHSSSRAFTRARRLPQEEYLRPLHIFAPDRNVHKLDAELEALHTNHYRRFARNIDYVVVRFDRQLAGFRSIIREFETESHVGGDSTGEPESVALSWLGLRIVRTLEEYGFDSSFGPRDRQRTKLSYLIVQVLLETGTFDEFEAPNEPSAFEILCNTFTRLNLAGNHTSSDRDINWATGEPIGFESHVHSTPDGSTSDVDTTDEDMHLAGDTADSIEVEYEIIPINGTAE